MTREAEDFSKKDIALGIQRPSVWMVWPRTNQWASLCFQFLISNPEAGAWNDLSCPLKFQNSKGIYITQYYSDCCNYLKKAGVHNNLKFLSRQTDKRKTYWLGGCYHMSCASTTSCFLYWYSHSKDYLVDLDSKDCEEAIFPKYEISKASTSEKNNDAEKINLAYREHSGILWVGLPHFIFKDLGTSLVVPWLRICLPTQEMWVRSLVEELISHVPWSNEAPTPRWRPSAAKKKIDLTKTVAPTYMYQEY